MTVFFAFAPAMLADHYLVVFGMCIAVGEAALPGRFTGVGVLGRAVYAVAIVYAVTAWAFFVLPSYFPDSFAVAFRGANF